MVQVAWFDPFRMLAKVGPLRREVMDLINGLWLGPVAPLGPAPEPIGCDLTQVDQCVRICAKLLASDCEEITVCVQGDEVLISARPSRAALSRHGELARADDIDRSQTRAIRLPQAVDGSRAMIKMGKGSFELVVPKWTSAATETERELQRRSVQFSGRLPNIAAVPR